MKQAPDKITEENREYVSLALAAQISGYHEMYVRRLVLRGEIPAIRKTYDGFVKVYVLRSALTQRAKLTRYIVRLPEDKAPELTQFVQGLGGTVAIAKK